MVGFLLQAFGVGLAVGMFIAYRAQQRNPRRDPFPIQVRWGALGLVVGVVYALGYVFVKGVL